MILVLDEFDNSYQANEIDDDIIEAVNDGECTAYRFDKNTNKIQRYDYNQWVDIINW